MRSSKINIRRCVFRTPYRNDEPAASWERLFLCYTPTPIRLVGGLVWGYTFPMSITKTIESQIPEAMRAKDSVRLNTLRGIKAACVNELVAKRRKPEETLTDEETRAVIKRLVNQRKDSILQFRKGEREELAQAEEAELKVLEAFLPEMMGEGELRKIAEGVKIKLGITDLPAPSPEARQAGKSKMGALIGAVMKETRGRADGAAVKSVVESLLA